MIHKHTQSRYDFVLCPWSGALKNLESTLKNIRCTVSWTRLESRACHQSLLFSCTYQYLSNNKQCLLNFQVELCEEIFPLIIHDILLGNSEEFRSVLSRQVRLFFHTVNSMPRPSSPLLPHPQISSGHSIHPDSVRIMLNMVMYLRTVDRPKTSWVEASVQGYICILYAWS